MNTLDFLGGGGSDESPRWGHSPRMRNGGSGDEGSLPNSFGWEFILFVKTHFYGGALTSHSWRSIHLLHFLFSMTSSNGNMFRVPGFCAGNSPVTAGNTPVNSPHTDQWRGALVFSFICAWTNGWVNNQDAANLRRHRAHYDVTLMWCPIVIQWSGQPWELPVLNASNLGAPCIMEGMAPNLAHCSTLITIPWN